MGRARGDRFAEGEVTTRAAESVTMSSATSKVVAILEDYAGNTATTVLRGN
ncbi:hypothetical protein [Nonomuraea sp. NEAU-A123]|uniref:hypothetical protein n=1 Tax=Nonomuraea sp. NEAU-A123 TaxID=2839649 RepID=UPI001BE470BD|nr:hypothetical protein [Nonomuraea sp. NEAU-A123]MBT2233505.1 hypothetical protein [Nonomuraea sp. NEAU-A123]